jgi:hypothetical protein
MHRATVTALARALSSFGLLSPPFVFAVMLLAPSTAIANGTPLPDPTERLAIWTGRWNYSERDFTTPYSQAHADTGTANCGWSPNRRFVICDYLNANPPQGVPVNDIAVLSYDPIAKTYAHVGVFASHKPIWQSMTVRGNTWIASFDFPYKGKTLIYRDVYVYSDDGTRTSVAAEISADQGRTWTTVTQFKAIKVGR